MRSIHFPLKFILIKEKSLSSLVVNITVFIRVICTHVYFTNTILLKENSSKNKYLHNFRITNDII